MSEQPPPHSTTMPDEDPQAEEPIMAIKDLERNTSPFFLRNIRRRIRRRTAASQILTFSWELPKIAFVELGSMMAHVLSVLGIRKGD